MCHACRYAPATVGRVTPFPLVDAIDRDWRHSPDNPDRIPGYLPVEETAGYLETRRPDIPSATERWARPEPRTRMVIVPTWFVHPLAVEIPQVR